MNDDHLQARLRAALSARADDIDHSDAERRDRLRRLVPPGRAAGLRRPRGSTPVLIAAAVAAVAVGAVLITTGSHDSSTSTGGGGSNSAPSRTAAPVPVAPMVVCASAASGEASDLATPTDLVPMSSASSVAPTAVPTSTNSPAAAATATSSRPAEPERTVTSGTAAPRPTMTNSAPPDTTSQGRQRALRATATATPQPVSASSTSTSAPSDAATTGPCGPVDVTGTSTPPLVTTCTDDGAMDGPSPVPADSPTRTSVVGPTSSATVDAPTSTQSPVPLSGRTTVTRGGQSYELTMAFNRLPGRGRLCFELAASDGSVDAGGSVAPRTDGQLPYLENASGPDQDTVMVVGAAAASSITSTTRGATVATVPLANGWQAFVVLAPADTSRVTVTVENDGHATKTAIAELAGSVPTPPSSSATTAPPLTTPRSTATARRAELVTSTTSTAAKAGRSTTSPERSPHAPATTGSR